MFFRKLFVSIVFALAISAPPLHAQNPAAETFGNAQVIELHQLGLPDATVIAKIKAVNGKYDTSISALKALKAAGISSEIITAMLETQQKPAAAPMPSFPGMEADPNDPMAQYEPGTYIKGTDGKLVRMLSGKVTAQGPSGSMLNPFAGLTAKSKYFFSDVEPVITTSRTPEFTFYFADKLSGQNMFSRLPLANMVIVKLEKEDGRLMFSHRLSGDISGILIRLKVEKVYKSIVCKAVPISELPDGDYAIGNYDFDAAGSKWGKITAASQLAMMGLYPFTVKGGVVK